MSRDDIHKLLGGYATGTLTPEEQQVLFEAALDDQELFDALAREQALRDLLQDPGAKAQLLAALDRKPVRWYERLFTHWRPLAAAAAMAGVGAIAVVVWQNGRSEKPVLVAKFNPPPAASAPESQTEPSPQAMAPPSPAETRPSQPKTEAKPAAPVAVPREERGAAAASTDRPEMARRQVEKAIAPQQEAEQKRDQKDAVRADSDARLPLAPGIPANGLATGFRQNAGSGGRGNLGGAAPSPPPPPVVALQSPKPQPQPLQPSAQTQAPQTPSAQSAQGQLGQQGAFGGQQPLQSRSPQDLIPLSPPQAKTETVQVQANASLVDTVATPDAKTLFYARTVSAPAGMAGSGFGAARVTQAESRKKVAPAGSGGRSASNAPATAELDVQARAVNPGVKYDFERETAGGNWQAVDPLALKTGDVVRLEMTANDRGLLQVQARNPTGGWREILSRSVSTGQSYPTAALAAGEKEVQVTFTRLPAVGGMLRDDKGQVRKQSEQDATYVVGGPGANQVQFVITLNFQ